MSPNALSNFFNFPPNYEEFPTYESKIHIEIASLLAEVSGLIFSKMKNLTMEEKKRLFKIKEELDKVKTQFEVIKSSIFNLHTPQSKILSLHHETVIILDFLILDRVIDFSAGLKFIEQDQEFEERVNLLANSLTKLSKLVEMRKITQDLPPSKEFFENMIKEFAGDLYYLDSLGIFHEYEELEKPLRGNMKKYYEELKRYFHKACIDLVDKNMTSISFLEFVELFKKKYPGVEFSKEDLEKAARDLNSLGLVGLVHEGKDSVKTIMLVDDSKLQKEILELATENGYTTQEDIIKQLSVPIEKSLKIIEKLENSGLAIVDDYSSGKRIYFPGLYKEEKE
ncbi:MAG: hypothetical protein ACTSX6_07695 [Candidatus Heimdallarchaeaceae archaeon]